MTKYICDEKLTSQVNKLPKELEPERDLWQGIERAIQHKAQHQNIERNIVVNAPLAWAASIVIAVLVTWLSVTPSLDKNQTSIVKQQVLPREVGDQLVSAMAENFQQQKQAMLVSFGNPDLEKLSTKMQSQLNQLLQARKAIESALAKDENNTDLLNLLRFTQQQELSLLQQLYPIMNSQNSLWQTI